MKPSLYKIAAMALVCLTGISAKTFAQQSAGAGSSSSSSSQTTPPVASAPAAPNAYYNFTPPPAIDYGLSNMNSYNFAPMTAMAGDLFGSMGSSQDTTYLKKMKQLQDQMREAQKQMSDLQRQMSAVRTEEMKKNSEEMRKRMNEQSQKMSESMAKTFQNFGQNMRFKFNIDNTEDLDKKVASGEYKLKSKSYSKSYPVDAKDKLQIENHFGKITVNTWAKNEVKVDVEIKSYANTDDDAQKLLDQVKINDKKDNDGVSFTTVISDEDHKNSFWGTMTNNGKTTVRKTIVNYTVYMPAKSALTISNTYGAIILPELSGKLNINNSWGNFTAKALTNPDNAINVKYGSADIESLTGSDLKVSFGSLNLVSADRLTAELSYSPAKIGTINTSGTISLHFGEGLQISNLGKSLKTLSVNSSYAPIKLGSLNNDNADFDVTVHNGGFSYDNGVNVTSKSPDDSQRWSSTQNYKGKIGKGNSDKVITIKSTFSSVKFDQ